jgi:hypothetical protein
LVQSNLRRLRRASTEERTTRNEILDTASELASFIVSLASTALSTSAQQSTGLP